LHESRLLFVYTNGQLLFFYIKTQLRASEAVNTKPLHVSPTKSSSLHPHRPFRIGAQECAPAYLRTTASFDTFALRLCKYRESIPLTRDTQLQLAVARLLHGEHKRERDNTHILYLDRSRNHVLMTGQAVRPSLGLDIDEREGFRNAATLAEQRSEAQTIGERFCKILGTRYSSDSRHSSTG
jgi:hypothetical protein